MESDCDKNRESVGEGRENNLEPETARTCDKWGFCDLAQCPDWLECRVYGFRIPPN